MKQQHPDLKLYINNDLKKNWIKNEIFDKKPIVYMYIGLRIFYFIVHDVIELVEGMHDPQL